MTSAIYASLATFLIVWLSLEVIRRRHRHGVNFGDGGVEALRIAIAAQSNATEYIPVALLLLFALDSNGGHGLLLHLLGITLLTGRVIDARAMLTGDQNARVLGMKVTLLTLLGLALANFIYLPWDGLFA